MWVIGEDNTTKGLILNIKLFCHFPDIKLILVTIIFFLFVPFTFAAESKIEDSDGDGLSDQYEESIGTEPYLSDTDGDGINDGVEIGDNLNKPLNSDNDRYIDALDYDDDNDGLPTILEGKKDTDKDGLKDYLDADSDNDNISDGIEAGMLKKDDNFDLIDDAFDSEQLGATDKNGDGINDNYKLPDYNGDGVPDYLDAKYPVLVAKKTPRVRTPKFKTLNKKLAINSASNKVAKKAINRKKLAEKQLEELLQKRKKLTLNTKKKEKVESKIAKNMVINRYTDTDNDGLLDTQERIIGTNPFKRDTDGDKVSDAIEIGMDINSPQDSDHDGIIDALDPDDDNDGIFTKNEDVNKDSSPINDDTDNDGVPNYLDANDDGDNKLTLAEGGTKDTDKDGILDYLDKNDGVKDSHKLAVKKQFIPDTPEVIVLFDGNLESLGADVEEDHNESIAKKMIDETIENASLDSDDKGNHRQDSSPKEKKGFIAWLTSLLPD